MGLWPIAGHNGWRSWEGLCQQSTACWPPLHWSNNLVLISRNLKDVADLPVAVANPWDPDGSGL